MPRSLKDLQASARALTRANCAALERLEKRWTAPPVGRAEEIVLFDRPSTSSTLVHKVVPPPARSAEDQIWTMAQAYSTEKGVAMGPAITAIAKQHPALWQQRIDEGRDAQRVREHPQQPATVPVQKVPLVPVPYPYATPALSQLEQLMRQVAEQHPDWTAEQVRDATVQTVEGSRAWARYRYEHLYPREV